MNQLCGRCGHNDSAHERPSGEGSIGSCCRCRCPGFIPKTRQTKARYEPFADRPGAPIIEGSLTPDELADWRANLMNPEMWTRTIREFTKILRILRRRGGESARDDAIDVAARAIHRCWVAEGRGFNPDFDAMTSLVQGLFRRHARAAYEAIREVEDDVV